MPIFKSHLYELSAYQPPLEGRDPDKHLLLDFNERTLPVSAPVRDALIDYIRSDRIQLYPSYGDIVQRLSEYTGADASQIMISNGSDQGIELVFRACGEPGEEVIIPEPNFAMYNQCAQIEGMTVVAPFYSRDNGLPVKDIIAAVNEKTRVICIASPNNPSGVGAETEDILSIAQAAPEACVLVDECYFEYSQKTVAGYVAEYPNIVITRTFSKTWGMPSLRFGYLIAADENIQALLSVRGPYDINQLGVVAARAALDNPEYTERYVKEVMTQSKPEFEAFLDTQNIQYWPSEANYVWMFPSQPGEVERLLQASNILVRPKKDADGNIGLRVTLGSLEQTLRLIEVLKGVLPEGELQGKI